MAHFTKLVAASVLALAVAVPATAQGNLIGINVLDDRIDDITDDVNEELRRGEDAQRFGPMDVIQGWRGSLALQSSATFGNTDDVEVSGAGRLTYGFGPWNHLFGFAVEYGKANGVTNEESFFATYEGSRYFTEQVYAFGLGRGEYDSFASNEIDAFIGAGPGVRIINTSRMAWRVQAGPGVRYIEDPLGNSNTEVAGVAASRFFYGLTDTLSLTKDTDFLFSETNLIATNDIGLNYKVTDNLSTRISYRTDYNSAPLPGFEEFDNKLGLSLVLGF